MTSFSIDEHSSMNNTIPNLTSADTTPQISSTPNLPPILPQIVATTKVNNDNNTSTNNDDNETEINIDVESMWNKEDIYNKYKLN